MNEHERLSKLVADFAESMRAKLWKKLRQGYVGWEDDTDPQVYENLRNGLQSHVLRYQSGDASQLVDIANFCAMLWRAEAALKLKAEGDRRARLRADKAGL